MDGEIVTSPESGEQSDSRFIGSPVADLDYINSERYKAKFSNLTEDKNLNRAIYERCKAAVIHQSGKYTEDLTVLDASTGQNLYTTSSKQNFETLYTAGMKADIKSRPRYSLASVHNHGTNLPPSGSDLATAGHYGYKFGVVACNDGEVYYYSIENAEPFTSGAYDFTVEKFKQRGYNVREAMMQALDAFSKSHGLNWRVL